MKYKIAGLSAKVFLTELEAQLIRNGMVPTIYSPGGMALHEMPDAKGGEVKFGGACFVDAEEKLVKCLEKFQQELEYKTHALWTEVRKILKTRNCGLRKSRMKDEIGCYYVYGLPIVDDTAMYLVKTPQEALTYPKVIKI